MLSVTLAVFAFAVAEASTATILALPRVGTILFLHSVDSHSHLLACILAAFGLTGFIWTV